MKHHFRAACLALLVAACRQGQAGEAPDAVIARDRFVAANVAVRSVPDTAAKADSLRAAALKKHRVTEAQLRGFVAAHGRDVAFMAEVWKEVAEKVEKEYDRQYAEAHPEAAPGAEPPPPPDMGEMPPHVGPARLDVGGDPAVEAPVVQPPPTVAGRTGPPPPPLRVGDVRRRRLEEAAAAEDAPTVDPRRVRPNDVRPSIPVRGADSAIRLPAPTPPPPRDPDGA